MVSIFTRGGLVALVAATALAFPSAGLADDPPVVTRAPEIQGKLVVGETLRAVNGEVTGSPDAATNYTWRRCPDEDFEDCITILRANGETYTLTDAEAGFMMLVTLSAQLGEDSSSKNSEMTAPVKTTSGTTPAVPQPSFNLSAPVPTNAAGSVFPAGLKRLKPKPKVSITGRYTSTGAKITRFTITTPKGVKVTLACSKGTCPVKKQFITGGHTSHVSKFERTLKTGTTIQLTVSRKGYVTEATVLTIRAKRAPARSDGCIAPGRTKLQKCPA